MNPNNSLLVQSVPIFINPISQIPVIVDYYNYFNNNNRELNNNESDNNKESDNNNEFNNKLENLLDNINTKIKNKKLKKCDKNFNNIYSKINELSIKLNDFNNYITNTLDSM